MKTELTDMKKKSDEKENVFEKKLDNLLKEIDLLK
jgi:hypothetical protein